MPVGIEIKGHIAIVTLNRPEALNSIDPETRSDLRDVFGRIGTNNDIRVVLLTGTGEKAFCTGSDLKKTMPPKTSFAQQAFGAGTKRDTESITKVLEIPQPVICAINGIAVAGGLELAMACDIRIAVSTASFGLSEVRVGSIPGGGGTQRLPRLVGLTNAMPLLLGGGRIDAAEALRIGLVSKLVEPADLMEEALAIAEGIAANAPLAVRAVKALVYQGVNLPLSEGLEMERITFGIMRDTKDRIEGRLAFAEKRKPNYVGE
ncbi:Enoyl-CoA hydratase/isomerase [Rhizobium sp. CF080]|uniref:enoyl-CoA hydratase/isomerase family protein n=1 Tax=Rhizobium sp. (strain CF080) TaxID=1144310 RepID=UPI0002717881|nr:enoyl-CoA hydratase-related protein [Rhizobium sp. CF080]EUB98145.1 Enoyl-CoA hydratase/isomerase [Rhizobium sp. CF080]